MLIQSRTLIYQRLQGEKLAYIPKTIKQKHSNTITAPRQLIFLKPKDVKNFPSKTSKYQIDKKYRKWLLILSFKSLKTIYNGNPTF